MRAAAGFSVIALNLAAAFVLYGQDDSFWAFLSRDKAIERCAAGTPAAKAARAALDELAARIDRLRDGNAHAPVVEELHVLLRTPCFLAAAETDRLPRPDSAASLREWADEGGLNWLHSYLELPTYGEISALRPHVVLPPDARPTLSAATAWNAALAGLVCRPGDGACGGRTSGWRDRAEAAFEVHHQAGRHLSWDERDKPRDAGGVARSCAAGDAGPDPLTRYHAWRECLETNRPRRRAMPLGSTRPPERGWFIIEGRRGHYDFCDGIAAYDLATGSALAVRSCSSLALLPGGHVDFKATNAARVERIEAGMMAVDNLREAVWMIALQPQVPELQVASEAYPIPEGMAVVSGRRRLGQDEEWQTQRWTALGSTAQTELAWHWLWSGRVPASGGLLLASFEAHEAHAESLLLIAEAGLIEGCIRARPPQNVTFGSKESEDRYQDALKKWRRAPLCR